MTALVTAARGARGVETGGLFALVIFLLLLLSGGSGDLLPSPARMGLVLAWPIVIAGFWATRRASLVVAYCLAGGLLLRWVDFPPGGAGGSDVLVAIGEALGVLLGGGNPYLHEYQLTRPPGQAMPYPPGALLLHLPGYVAAGLVGMQLTQVALAGLGILLLALLGALAGWAVTLPAMALYAGLPNLVNLSVDGSNDTGTGVLVLAALAALTWSLRAAPPPPGQLVLAGLLAGLAISTKQTAVALVSLPAVYLWRRHGAEALKPYAGATAAVLVGLSLPFLVWDPIAYVGGLLRFIGAHDDLFGWNVWVFAQQVGWPVWESGAATVLSLAVGAGALAAAALVSGERLTIAVLAGLLVTLAVFLTARWTSYAYFALLAPALLALPTVALWESQREPHALVEAA